MFDDYNKRWTLLVASSASCGVIFAEIANASVILTRLTLMRLLPVCSDKISEQNPRTHQTYYTQR
jgi:hypothetical protein